MKTLNTISFLHKNYKLIIGAIIVLFIACLLFSNKDIKRVDASTYNEKYFTCITIKDGDTLISIAEEYISEEYSSIDDYVKEVKSINNLTNDVIYRGATLVVPYYAAPQ